LATRLLKNLNKWLWQIRQLDGLITFAIMPSLADPEIKELLKAIERGDVDTTTFGYKEVGDVVNSIKLLCEDEVYRDKFISWWCRYKKKTNAKLAITPLPPAEVLEADPPLVPPSQDRPPPYKGPKTRSTNQPKPKPAPSPTPAAVDTPQYSFEGLFGDEALAAPPKPSPKFQSPTKKPSQVKKSPVAAPIMSMSQTPEERALEWIMAQPEPADTIKLTLGEEQGLEWYKVPWPDEGGQMHVTYIVKGYHRAEIQAGGKSIHLTTDRSQVIRTLIEEIKDRFSHKLSNPSVANKLTSFENMFDKVMNKKAYRQQVSTETSMVH